jgi:benzoyl-CoA 2,3-dioxygenase component B
MRHDGLGVMNALDFQIALPSQRFRRAIGPWSHLTTDPQGTVISPEEYERRKAEFLPTEADRAYVKSLMKPVMEPGKVASWIAPPDRGINNQPVDYEYVHVH